MRQIAYFYEREHPRDLLVIPEKHHREQEPNCRGDPSCHDFQEGNPVLEEGVLGAVTYCQLQEAVGEVGLNNRLNSELNPDQRSWELLEADPDHEVDHDNYGDCSE